MSICTAKFRETVTRLILVRSFIECLANSGESRNFEKGKGVVGERQCTSPVVMYCKCTQRTIGRMLFIREKASY